MRKLFKKLLIVCVLAVLCRSFSHAETDYTGYIVYVSSSTGIVVESTDTASGIAYSEYSIDGSSWTLFEDAVFLREENQLEFNYRSADNVQNLEPYHSVTVVCDTSAPVSRMTVGGPSFEYNGMDIVSKETFLKIEAEDSLSGIRDLFFKVNGATESIVYPGGFSFSSIPGNVFRDEFNMVEMEPGWSWINEDISGWNLTDSREVIQIYAEEGSMEGSANDQKNLMVRPSVSTCSFTVETKLSFAPDEEGQGAGIWLLNDNDNFLKLTKEFNCIEAGIETGAAYSSIGSLQWYGGTSVYLKAVRENGVYSLSCSSTGADWTIVGSTAAGFAFQQAGLGACSTLPVSSNSAAGFDYFSIYENGEQDVSDGVNTVKFYSVDNVGNREEAKARGFFVDSTPPEVVISSPVAGSTYVAYRDTITIDFSVIDNSGIPAQSRASLYNESESSLTVTNGQVIDPVDLSTGSWRLAVETADSVGNSTSVSSGWFEVIHDIQPPRTILLAGDPKYYDGNMYVTAHTTFSLVAEDDMSTEGDGVGSGVSGSLYRINHDSWTVYSGTFSLTGKTEGNIYPSDSLLGRWDFNEGAGSVLHDISGNGNDGEINGCQWVEGISGKALSFDGVDDYVDFGDVLDPGGNNMTIAAWTKTSLQDGPGGMPIAKYKGFGGAPWYGFYWNFANGGKNDFALVDAQGNECVANDTTSLNDGRWHHVVSAIDNDNDILKIYIDGELKVTESGIIEHIDTVYPLYFGKRYNDSLPLAFYGVLDEVAVYDRVLSGAEIEYSYNCLKDQICTFSFFSEDNSGNIEEENSLQVVVDNTSPAISNEFSGPHVFVDPPLDELTGEASGDTYGLSGSTSIIDDTTGYYLTDGDSDYMEFEYIGNPGPDFYSGKKVDIHYITSDTCIMFNATDTLCGVDTVEYKLYDSGWLDAKNAEVYLSNEDNIYMLYMRSSDMLGNEQDKEIFISLDNTAPVTEIEINEPAYESEGIFYAGTENGIGFRAEDGVKGSGVEDTFYCIDGNDYVVYSGTFNLMGYSGGFHSIKFYSTDKLGNIEDVLTASIYLDSNPPETRLAVTPSYEKDNTLYFTSKSTVTLDAVDDFSGIAATKWRLDSHAWVEYIYPFTMVGSTITTVSNVQGCISRWSFDESDTDTVIDLAGRNNGTIYGDTQRVPGKIGKAMKFDGDGDYVEFGDVLDPHTNDQTIVAWVKTDVQEYGPMMPISKYRTAPGPYPGFYWNYANETRNDFIVVDTQGNSVNAQVTQNLRDDEWHHVAMVIDNLNDSISVYVDGQLNSTGSGTINDIDTTFSLYLGCRNYSSAPMSFSGMIDEVEIYSRVLTPEEIDDIYQKGQTVRIVEGPHLLEYFSVDGKGNREQNKLQNVVIDDTPPETGLYIGAPNYEGVAEYITVNSSTPFVFTSTDTYSGVSQLNWELDEMGENSVSGTVNEINFSDIEGGIHHIRFYSVDNLGNREDVQVSTFIFDNTAPAEITDLSVAESGATSVTLSWTAPGDDGAEGEIVGGKYNIGYSTFLIEGSMGSGTDIIWSTNTAPGSIETKQLTGLNQGTEYYFHLRAEDGKGNWSDWSDIIAGRTYNLDTSSDALVSLYYQTAELNGNTTDVYIIEKSTDEPDTILAVNTALQNGLGVFSSIYNIMPDGVAFVPYAELTFYYDDGQLAEYGIEDEAELDIYKFYPDTDEWKKIEPVSGRDPENNLITVELYSASIYAVLGEIPDNTPPVTNIGIAGDYYVSADTVSYVSLRSSFTLTAEDPEVFGWSSGIQYTEFSVDRGSWTIYEEPSNISVLVTFPMEGEHDIRYRSVDNCNNLESVSTFTFIVDRLPPEIVITSPESDVLYIAEKDTITISFSTIDNSSFPVQSSSYLAHQSGSTMTAINGQEIEPLDIESGLWKLTVEAEDIVGNSTSTSTGWFEVIHDIQPPRTTMVASCWSPVAGETYITSKTSITLSAVDDLAETGDGEGLGVLDTRYRISDSSWTVYESSFSITGEDGIYDIGYYSIDVIGNAEAEKRHEIILDNTAPVTEILVSEPRCQLSENEIYVTSDSTIGFIAEDPGDYAAGVVETRYRISDIPSGSQTGYRIYYDTGGIHLEEGVHGMEYQSSDNLGNTEGIKSVEIHVDNTAPVTSHAIGDPKYDYGTDTPTIITSQTPVTLTAEDPAVSETSSGVSNIYYRINNGSTFTYAGDIYVTGEDGVYSITYWSQDNLMNTEEMKSFSVTLDNTQPVCTLISPDPASVGVCTVFRATVPVYGKVSDFNFNSWRLEYATGTNATEGYVTIKESGALFIEETAMVMWNTYSLPDGYYTLRLVARDNVGNKTISKVNIYIGEPEYLFSYKYEENGHGRDRFEPAYIAIDKDNNSYVTDHYTGRIIKFDEEGTVAAVFGGSPRPGGKYCGRKGRGDWRNRVDLDLPEGIVVDEQGNMYVADRLHNRVVKLDSEGNIIMEIGGGGDGCWARDIGRWQKRKKSHEERTFNWPTGVALDSEGNIWVADRFNNRIQKFTPEGELVEDATICTEIFDNEHRGWNAHWGWWHQRQVYKPGGIAIDKSDNIYVADQFHERVLKYSPAGEVLLEIGEDNEKFKNQNTKWNIRHPWYRYKWEKEEKGGTAPGQLRNPDGILVTGSGYIYVADQSNNRVQKFDRYGNFVMEWGSEKAKIKNQKSKWWKKKSPKEKDIFDSPGGIACTGEGIVHVVDRDNYKVQVFGLPEDAENVSVTSAAGMSLAEGPDPAFKLGDVYSFPNPARCCNPTIHFECGVADKVKIKIYDVAADIIDEIEITGRPDVVNGRYAYEHTWDADGRASGVYIYYVEGIKGEEKLRKIKKMAVIK